MSTPAAVQKMAAPPRQSRMTLANVTRGRISAPWLLIVYGVDGVGKSSLGAGAPSPIFLGPEKGTNHLDVARFPVPETWQDVLDAIRALTVDAGGFRTLVVDTFDWLEPLLIAELCRRENVKSREDVGGGYGKWADAAVDELRVLFAAVERLQAIQKMNFLGLAHAETKTWKNPQGDDFDRYMISMPPKMAAVLRQWVEGVYFANYETFADKDKRTKRVRGISTGARYLYTQRTAAYDAKDRYGLPEQVALDWSELEAKRASAAQATEALRAECERKAKELGGEIEKFSLEYLTKNPNDAIKLGQLNTKLNAKLAEKAELAAAAATPASEVAPATV
jgi:hypothetical protein